MRVATKPSFSPIKRSSSQATSAFAPRMAAQEPEAPVAAPVEVSAPVTQPTPAPQATQVAAEGREQAWLRVTGLDVSSWLASTEQERRFRLQAASSLGSDQALSTPQREELLQRIDAYAAGQTGEPQPVYRGVPVRDAAPVPAPQPDRAEPAPAGLAAGMTESSRNDLMAVGGTLLVLGLVAWAATSSTPRRNPSGRRKKSWWSRMWEGSKPKTKKRRRAKRS